MVFGLVWIAWVNGSLYHELHGREDGRSRSSIFVQMLQVTVLAVFAAHATEEDGAAFAVTYALLLALLALQWWSVHRYDIDPADRAATARYVAGLIGPLAVVLVSAFRPSEARLVLWGLAVAASIGYLAVQGTWRRGPQLRTVATESMAERFGLFTIIVLGEVVVGVVDGLSEAERDALTMATGLLALTIGFGFWWNSFDAIGRRLPQASPGRYTAWILGHLPLTGAIAAAGAGMVSLIEHAGDTSTPAATAWLLAGASALMLVVLAGLINTIDYGPDLTPLVPRLTVRFAIGAAVSLVIGALQPAAWLLALLLSLVHSAVWFAGFALRASAIPASPVPDGD